MVRQTVLAGFFVGNAWCETASCAHKKNISQLAGKLMKVTEEEKGDITILKIEGAISSETSSDLRKIFADFVKEESKNVVIDLSQVRLIDSTGIAALIGLHAESKAREGGIALCSLTGSVQHIFATTRLVRFFAICDTLEEAIGNLQFRMNEVVREKEM
jgi:anti-sigma B factor antagonist